MPFWSRKNSSDAADSSNSNGSNNKADLKQKLAKKNYFVSDNTAPIVG